MRELKKQKLCVNLFTTRKIVNATGKPFMCELFHADMIDVIWMNVGIFTQTLKYLHNVILQHNHNTRLYKPDEYDETFERLRPLQELANSKENQRIAQIYATFTAGNMIKAGIGAWNTL